MIRAIVTDIEGTTSSLSFVKDVLFPYALNALPGFVAARGSEPEIKKLLDSVDKDTAKALATLERWIAEDKKETALKALQGHIWQKGYETGELVADVYSDAQAALKHWKAEGLKLYVYSSGSIAAQKLLFAHTAEGDLTPLFSGYFDTTTGPKREAASYTQIAREIGYKPEEILFLSDVVAELDAAKAAGFKTVWVNRYRMPEKPPHAEVRHFGEIGYFRYRALSVETVPEYLTALPKCAAQLGGAAKDWNVREVGDGNLNLVFLVDGPKGSLCVKQALPYVRLVGESWPLPLTRAHYEYLALKSQVGITPERVPALYHHDADLALTVMECLSPHIILRKGLIAGKTYPNMPRHIGQFMARNLFYTSDFQLLPAEKRERFHAFSGNNALCKITEDLVFTEPFFAAPMNRWTTPQLDKTVADLQKDDALKMEAAALKHAFLTRAEALLHGDLHSGSVMVTESDTRIIDPEFACYGPIGFDVGMFLANLFLNYFAQDRAEVKTRLLDEISDVWAHFAKEFSALWRGREGESYSRAYQLTEAGLKAVLEQIFEDAVGFCGLEIIRRIVGLAHVEDLESITDAEARAAKEKEAIAFARRLMLERRSLKSIAAVVGGL